MKNYGFNPVGVPILLGASGNSHEGGTNPGEDPTPGITYQFVGNYFVNDDDYGDMFPIYKGSDGSYYVLVDDDYQLIREECIDFG